MSVLSAGHLFTDLNQGAVAALLPFLVEVQGLSLAAAGTLVLAATVSSSVVQPLFGVFSDNRPLPALMPLGVLFAGIGMALVGVAPSYPLILLCVVLSGMGVAAFHPEAARFANYVSGARRARAMSFFSVGGNAGFAIGPALTTPLVLAFVASYYGRVLGTSHAFGNAALTVMLAAGAVGTLLMGPLADRFGRRAVVGASMLLLPPLIYGFTLLGPVLGMALLALVGAVTVGTFGVTVVMGQEYLPGRIGLAAGITMGLSIGLGGLGAPVLGLLADYAGLSVTMLVIAALPVIGLFLTLTLPRNVPSSPKI